MNNTHTAYDVMKEYLITDAELDGLYQIPMLSKSDAVPGKGIDFVSSKARSLKGHKDLTVNFYIDDKSFLQVWNQPDQYIEHLKCFNSVCSPDFTIASGMPSALNIYNLYRNHALGYYWAIMGVKIIPSVNIISLSVQRKCPGYSTERRIGAPYHVAPTAECGQSLPEWSFVRILKRCWMQ